MALLKPRMRSIRARIALLLIIPLLSLVGLWGFALSLTFPDARGKFRIDTAYEGIGLSAASLMGTLQYERKLSAVHVASEQGTDGQLYQQLVMVRGEVDKHLNSYREKALTEEMRDAVGERTSRLIDDFSTRLDGLTELRGNVDNRKIDAAAVAAAYTQSIGASLGVFESLVLADDVELYRKSDALISYTYAREFVMQEDTMVSAALAGDGRLTKDQFRTFAILVAGQQQMTRMSRENLGAEVAPLMAEVVNSPHYATLGQLERAVQGAADGDSGRLPASLAQQWPGTVEQLLKLWETNVNKAGAILKGDAEPIGDRVIWRLSVAAGAGLLAVAVSIALSVTLVRGLTREIGQLQNAARELAEQRLPWVVGRLRRGETVDVAREVPPLDIGARTTEVARVADAFNRVQNTAMQTAVGEAHLRKGISRVFLNLAWRSQSLLHRQLRMLDALERKAPDPDTLNDLFQLDHLTTRMRRHAEGLIILSGSAPGRSWSKPVHMSDVLRGAVAEVEDYTRVEAVSASPVALTGAAVTDVIHLLAELIENATAYSPPPTEVLVHGEVVGNGFAVEIVDRGVGLTPAEFAELNERLAKAPEFDLADTDRLGLFVVSRLAARHGIKVTLQPSAYGGVSAVVVMPHSLIVPESAIGDEQPSIEARRPTSTPAESGPWPVPPPSPAAPPKRSPAPVPTSLAPAGTASSVVPPREEGGLPRRVRQNSLAPQLRQGPLSAPPAEHPEPDDRDPEISRDLFSSLQAGWQRARNENDEDGYGS
ncbi:sensor histidine kinase [Actinocorallia populi]|uniref:sensor histidine kinase n=1 Tax=Actinocorallia populi TaxID=2079200 RepID=UPI000D096DD5|nr:nitrate- and nitrite sensing domain-containing protein [Actinocorallia populi]